MAKEKHEIYDEQDKRLGGARRAVLFPHGERPLAVEIPAREGFVGGKLSRMRG